MLRQGSKRSKLYEELGWETLSDSRWWQTISKLFYRYNNSNTFHEIRCKTSRYKNSFFPGVINSWNNIITNFQNSPTFPSLKAHILPPIRPKTKSTFGVRQSLRLRYIFQLWANLSPPRDHKNAIILLIPSLIFVSVIKMLKILAICYLNVLIMQLIEILQRKNLNQVELYISIRTPIPQSHW